jgi:hypothetical protein
LCPRAKSSRIVHVRWNNARKRVKRVYRGLLCALAVCVLIALGYIVGRAAAERDQPNGSVAASRAPGSAIWHDLETLPIPNEDEGDPDVPPFKLSRSELRSDRGRPCLLLRQ